MSSAAFLTTSLTRSTMVPQQVSKPGSGRWGGGCFRRQKSSSLREIIGDVCKLLNRHRFPVRSRTRHQVDLPLPTVEPSRRATCSFDRERFSLLTRCQGCLDRTWRQQKSSVAHGEPCAQLTPSSRSPPRRMRTTRCFGAAAHRSRSCSGMHNVEAIGHLGKAIDLAESLPDGPADGDVGCG